MYEKEIKEDIENFMSSHLELQKEQVKIMFINKEKYDNIKTINADFHILFKYLKAGVQKFQSIHPSLLSAKFFTFFNDIQNDIKEYDKIANIKDKTQTIFNIHYFPNNKCINFIDKDLSDKKDQLSILIDNNRKIDIELTEESHHEGMYSDDYKNIKEKLTNSANDISNAKKEIEDILELKNNFSKILYPIFNKIFTKEIDKILSRMRYIILSELTVISNIVFSKVNSNNDVKSFFVNFQTGNSVDIISYLRYNLKHQTSLMLIKEVKDLISELSQENN
jgi:hypothetical protein